MLIAESAGRRVHAVDAGRMCVVVEPGGETVCFPADLDRSPTGTDAVLKSRGKTRIFTGGEPIRSASEPLRSSLPNPLEVRTIRRGG